MGGSTGVDVPKPKFSKAKAKAQAEYDLAPDADPEEDGPTQKKPQTGTAGSSLAAIQAALGAGVAEGEDHPLSQG